MKLGDLQYPKKEDLQIPAAIDGDHFDRILLAMNTNARTFEGVLRENTEFADNTPYRIVKTKLQHGVESIIASPLPDKRRCVGAALLNCDGQVVLGAPVVRNTAVGGVAQLGITVQYAPPLGLLKRRMAGSVVTTNGIQIAMPFDTTALSIGNAIQLKTATQIQCLQPGIVQVCVLTEFDVSLNGYRDTAARHYNAAGSFIFSRAHATAPGGNYVYLAATELVSVAIGDYFDLFVFQNSGGNVSLAGSNESQSLTVQYVAPDPLTTATCTLLLISE